MSSIRRDLALSLATGVGVTFVLAGGLLWTLVRENSRRDFDLAQRARAGALGTLLECRNGKVEFDFADEVMPEFHRLHEPEYFEIWIRGGAVLERSLSLGDRDLPRRTGPVNAPCFWDLILPDGRPGRAVGMTTPVDFADDADVDHRRHEIHAETVVAASREGLDRRDAEILRALLFTGAVLVGAGIAVVWVAIHRVTRRIGTLTDQLEKVDSGSLDARLVTRELVTELRPLAQTLNSLLERLQHGFAREKRMTSNIAHELRTPVAELRAAADVARMWPDDPELATEALAVAAKVSVRMSSTIDTLLRLGRLETDGCSLEITEVDLAALICEIEAELGPEAGMRSCRIEHLGETQAIASADVQLARVLVRNLLENAITHSPEGSRIASEIVRPDGMLRWRIANPARDLLSDDVRFLGEPFWHKEKSRTGSQHPGLGLPLCRTICAALRWDLQFELESGTLHVFVHVN